MKFFSELWVKTSRIKDEYVLTLKIMTYRRSLPNATFGTGKKSHKPKIVLSNNWLMCWGQLYSISAIFEPKIAKKSQ